jgi:integrase
MSVYKRGGVWWYSFSFKGERVQASTRQSRHRIALQMQAAHRTRLALGQLDQPEPERKTSPTFGEFATGRYLLFSEANKSCFDIERVYINATLVPRLGRHRLDQITPLVVEEFKQKRLKEGLKKSSINRELGLLKAMLGLAVKWGLVEKNGAKEASLFKLDEPLSNRVLSHEEEEKLLAACDAPELRHRAPHLKAVILVAVYTGLRRGEILRLRWSDIDFEKNVLTVCKSKTKSGQGRPVNLNSMLRDVLLELRDQSQGEWLFPSPERFQADGQPERHIGDVKNAFARAMKLAGIAKITFHQLRHTFCSRLANAGVPLPVIQELAGHASILMTRRYTHPTNELKQRAVELLLTGGEGIESAANPPTAATSAAEQAKQQRRVVPFRRTAAAARQ